jgi:pimeloyl-ACP methyl ester carboxylesterase
VHPGRKKGVVIVAMPPGERHGLGVAMLADILADARYGSPALGPDTPTASVVAATRDAGCLAAVVVSVVDIERRPAAGRFLAAARRERPSVPRLVGGNAIPDERVALALGADGWVAGSARARRPDRSATGTGGMIRMPPPVAGAPFDLETAAGRVTAYQLGEGQTVLLLHSFNVAGSGIELAPLASRLAEHRRVVLVDWLGFGTSDRPDAPYGWALYGEQLERIRVAALQPGEASVDVVALSLPGQYVVVAAAEHPERFGRIVLISPTGFGRFKGDAGQTSRNIYRFLRLTGIGRLLFAVLARRQVIRWFLRQTFADPMQVPPEYERYCWRTCQQPSAYRAPLAFISGLLNDPRAEAAYQWLSNPTLLLFGDHPRFTDPAAAEALVAANGDLERITIEHAGDLPQLEQPGETAAVIDRFLA